MSPANETYLEYVLADDSHVLLQFTNINDRDGCHISLDMYKVNLGPITMEVIDRIARKFSGEIVTSF